MWNRLEFSILYSLFSCDLDEPKCLDEMLNVMKNKMYQGIFVSNNAGWRSFPSLLEGHS